MMLGELRGQPHELGRLTLHSGEGNMLNVLAWTLGMGWPSDITRHLPIYIGGAFEEMSHHHSTNTSSMRRVMQCVDELARRVELK